MAIRRASAAASAAALILLIPGGSALPALAAAVPGDAPAAMGVSAADAAAGGAAGTATGAAAGPKEPVTLFSLTDGSGEPTNVAVEGIEQLAAAGTTPGSGASTSGASARLSTDGASSGATMRLASTGAAAATAASTPAGDVDVDNIAVLTAPTATDEFVVAGLTWDADSPLAADARIFVRVQEGDDWSTWIEVEEEGEADHAGAQATTGTGPFLTGGAKAVQVQVTGAAAKLPTNLELSLIPSNPVPAEKVLTEPGARPRQLPVEEPTATTEPAAFESLAPLGGPVDAAAPTAGLDTTSTPSFRLASATTASVPAVGQPAYVTDMPAVAPAALAGGVVATSAPRPSIISRAGWGADESFMSWKPSYKTLKAAIVHHTAGTNNYAASQSASIVRGIYYYHAETRNWGDIGYNFLVDKYGQVFEGRSGSIPAPAGTMPQGAHAANANIGNFNPGTLGISAMGDYTQVGAPQVILERMADVIAWKFDQAGIDVNSASGIISPGTAARPRGQNLPRIFGHRDVGATSCPGNDIYGRLGGLISSVDKRLAHMFYLNNAFTGRADIAFDYGNANDTFLVGDWNGDGVDTLAIRRGNTFYVRNSNTTGAADTVFSYGNPGDVVLVGDWDGNGTDTLTVRRGNVFYVKNSISTGVADAVIAYGNPGDEVLVGDWNGDTKDTFAVRRGNSFFVKNTVTTGVADKVVMYGNPGDVVVVGDWNGDKVDTFGVRRGITYFLKNSITTGVADTVFAYGNPSDEILVGDWDGNGTDTLGVRRH
ncbi:N-acetylmuramoyl-L-alanine amidase [Georgenia sp. SYP-B2076]|uniref:N-acetylmuramoyl-L-alanine amidase n=1 Tax=Georgenia sp. SYP-B2076 TaxID=2495881 RepID=UPI000F8CF4D2|nr:N-acetylmuramoyl-L-alanine amidase [Georgenia sp. SYP-B2076]